MSSIASSITFMSGLWQNATLRAVTTLMYVNTLANGHATLSMLHLSQGIAQFALAATKNATFVPVDVTEISGGPPWGGNSTTTAVRVLSHAYVMYIPATFLLLTALAHFYTCVLYKFDLMWTFDDPPDATERKWKAYAVRWAEYSVTASIMIVAICLISGITNLYALIATAFCNFAMIMFGHLSDEFRRKDARDTNVILAWMLGALVGLAPWINIFVAIGLAGIDLTTAVGRLVIGMTGITATFFFSFATVSFYYSIIKRKTNAEPKPRPIENKRILTTWEEIWYPILSTVSKTMLAWLVFAALYTA